MCRAVIDLGGIAVVQLETTTVGHQLLHRVPKGSPFLVATLLELGETVERLGLAVSVAEGTLQASHALSQSSVGTSSKPANADVHSLHGSAAQARG